MTSLRISPIIGRLLYLWCPVFVVAMGVAYFHRFAQFRVAWGRATGRRVRFAGSMAAGQGINQLCINIYLTASLIL